MATRVTCLLGRCPIIRPISQIPQCTCSISHNAPFRTEMCTFLFWMVHCGIWDRCIVGFVNKVKFPLTTPLLPAQTRPVPRLIVVPRCCPWVSCRQRWFGWHSTWWLDWPWCCGLPMGYRTSDTGCWEKHRNMTPKSVMLTATLHKDIIVEGVPLSSQRIQPAPSRHFPLGMSTNEYRKKSDNWIVRCLKLCSEFLISCKVWFFM